MKKFKGILFDYGHTLVWFPHYERDHLVAARNAQKVLQKLGISMEASRIQSLMDNLSHQADHVLGMDEEFKEVFSCLGIRNWNQEDLKEIINGWWEPYVRDAYPRKGASELLRYLKIMGFKMGIVANIWGGGMNPVLRRLNMDRFFDTKVASIDIGFQKPDPRIFNLALKRLRLAPEQVIMVGDNPRTDIQAAKDLGIFSIRLMRGPNRTKPDLVDPDFKIRNLSTLRSIINKV
ncbi:MAG: HAD family hydrolase [Candidatus Bathyarchaeia archaeon]